MHSDMNSQNSKMNTRSLRGKGQFFVQSVCTEHDTVPIDNFVFITKDETEVRLSAVSGSWVVGFTQRKQPKYEWYDSSTDGMRRMADILDGLVTWEDFSKTDDPGCYAAPVKVVPSVKKSKSHREVPKHTSAYIDYPNGKEVFLVQLSTLKTRRFPRGLSLATTCLALGEAEDYARQVDEYIDKAFFSVIKGVGS